ncbi:hypothetical protein RSAG8_12810, partial [Rhizoctonia solani AG-8 WAC10335]
AIQGGWEGLHAMNLCGYVHRDVSSGNILLVPASGSLGQRGVIMDLEYAKKMDDMSSPHDGGVGTTAFMATEVALMRHHRLVDLRRANIDAHPNRGFRLRLKHRSRLLLLPPFRHNPLHDMESIWWLCIWMMFYLVPAGQSVKVQSDNYRQVFYNWYTKREFFDYPLEFYEGTAHLQGLSPFLSILERWSTALGGHYRSSYEQQDASNTLLKSIRIETNTIQASYKQGRAFLQQLVKASRSLSAIFVSVQEPSNAGHSTITTQPLADSLPTTSTEHLAAGPSTKTTKRPREIPSPRTIEREKVSSMKAT